MENYPSNSKKAKDETRQPKNVQKVVTGEVITRKKPFGRRFLEVFIGNGESGGVWGYILHDVLIPAAKDTVSDAVGQGIDRALFGEARGRGSRSRSAAASSYTPYNQYGGARSVARREDPRAREISPRARATHNFDEIIIATRAEAQGVIDQLVTIINDYDVATVNDLYDTVGLTGTFADEKYGWTDLRTAGISRIREGYLLDLPRPIEV